MGSEQDSIQKFDKTLAEAKVLHKERKVTCLQTWGRANTPLYSWRDIRRETKDGLRGAHDRARCPPQQSNDHLEAQKIDK